MQRASIRDEFLADMHRHKKAVAIFTSSGIKLIGCVEDYDEQTIVLLRNGDGPVFVERRQIVSMTLNY